jgi:hypothetical protein
MAKEIKVIHINDGSEKNVDKWEFPFCRRVWLDR